MFPPEAGQMIVEYVLLLLVAISLAMILRTALVKGGDDPSSSGAVLQRWQETAVGIGADDPNDRTK
jgi:hypothetical protein